MTWDPPTDDEVKEGNVVKASYHRRIRDLSEALADQDPGAPTITYSAIGVGGGASDGTINDATATTAPGWYFGSTVTFTANKTLPYASALMSRGAFDANSVTIDVTQRTHTTAEDLYAQQLGFPLAEDGANAPAGSNDGAGGAGGWGTGADGEAAPNGGGGTGRDALADWLTNMFNGSLYPEAPYLGGKGGAGNDGAGGAGGNGGGGLLIGSDGDMDLSSSTINLNGSDGQVSGTTGGGGGGGSLVILCRGTLDLTGCTINARGGDVPGANAGGGGGGFVWILAEDITGTPTVDVSGGTGFGGGSGTAGRSSFLVTSGPAITQAMRLLRIGL